MPAQTAPWVYPGGFEGNDEISDLAFPNPYDLIYACIKGDSIDSISFVVICLDREGKLVWEKSLNKNDYVEAPNNIAYDSTNNRLRVAGYADSNAVIWAFDLNAATGEVINNTADWTDLPDSSGTSIFACPGDTMLMMYNYADGKLNCYLSENLVFPPPIQSYSFLSSENAIKRIITDCEPYYLNPDNVAAMITGSYGPNIQPYIWIVNDQDSVFYTEPDIDSVIINGITSPYDTGIAIIGNLIDSSAIYLASYKQSGAGFNFILEFDTIYPSPGYPVIGKDLTFGPDFQFSLLTIHFDPAGTRTVLMKIDVAGNIISETTLFPEEKVTELGHIISFFGNDTPYIFGGLVATETPVKNNEYLVASSDTIPVFPGCIYDCVWPGDANNDGTVDMTDLFPIGAFYNYHGPVRDSVSIYWIGNVAEEWVYDFDGLNAKYANCYGDTMIYAADTNAIIKNYSDIHATYTLKNNGGDIPLWLNTTGIILEPGYNEIPIMLGTEEISVDNIYGLEFSISYEGLPVLDTTMRIKFHTSWLGFESQMIQLDTTFPEIHLIDAGVVNTSHLNHTGYGEIGKLSFVVEDNIAGIMIASGDSTIIFNISGPTAVLNDLSEISISGSACEVLVSTEVNNETPETNLMLFPNPWHGESLHIYPGNVITNNFRFELNTIDGSLVDSGELNSDVISVKDNLPAGEYILKITGDEHVYQFKLIHL